MGGLGSFVAHISRKKMQARQRLGLSPQAPRKLRLCLGFKIEGVRERIGVNAVSLLRVWGQLLLGAN